MSGAGGCRVCREGLPGRNWKSAGGSRLTRRSEKHFAIRARVEREQKIFTRQTSKKVHERAHPLNIHPTELAIQQLPLKQTQKIGMFK